MRIRKSVRAALTLGPVALLFAANPATAHEGGHDQGPPPGWHHSGMDPRDAWLADCRERVSRRDNGVGGAVIGGVVGGIAGNRIAGRGNRTVGTVAGAAVGAIAGAAIDRAEDAGQRDECEAYLDNYYASYGQQGYGYPGYGYASYGYGGGYAYPGYGYGYAAGGCCGGGVPMMMVPMQRSEPECTETVEYVYEDVPAPAPRQRTRYVPEKRQKIVPDKRVKIVPTK